MIYFILAKDMVKIGYTKNNVKSRLSSLQTGNPYKLKLLKVSKGGRQLERGIHGLLSSSHIRGEWFKYDQYVKDIIDSNLSLIMYNKKFNVKRKNGIITRTEPKTYRHASDTLEAIETYSAENNISNSKALDKLVGYGVTAWLNKKYNDELC